VEFRPGTGVSYESIDLAASRENAVS
jgi:hypothetical protein